MNHNTEKSTVTRSTLRDALHGQLGLTHHDASRLLESTLQTIVLMISKGHSIKLSGFGTFLIHNKKERIGRNPKTKQTAVISTRQSVSFRPSVGLRQIVNQRTV
jgi:integration host factor subunit alpha